MRFLTISQCCCGMENGGQRGWDDPCTPCPTKGSGKLTQNPIIFSIYADENNSLTQSDLNTNTCNRTTNGGTLWIQGSKCDWSDLMTWWRDIFSQLQSDALKASVP